MGDIDPAVAAVAEVMHRDCVDFQNSFGAATRHGADAHLDRAGPVVAAVRRLVLEEAAQAIEAEPNSHRVNFTDEDGNNDYVDQAHGSKHYSALVRGLAGVGK